MNYGEDTGPTEKQSFMCVQDLSFTENTEFDEPGAIDFQRGFHRRGFMDKGEQQGYGVDSGIPLGPGGLGDPSFGDRPFTVPGRERFREPWELREVHPDTVYVYFRCIINENEWIIRYLIQLLLFFVPSVL